MSAAAPEIARSRDLARDPMEIAQSGAINPDLQQSPPGLPDPSAKPGQSTAQPWPVPFNYL